jgi:hypothetical protein
LLKGQFTIDFAGQTKSYVLHELNNGKTEERTSSLEKIASHEDPNIVASNVKSSDIQEREKVLSLSGDIAVKGHITKFDNQLYVTPDPFNDFVNLTAEHDRLSPLDLSKRNFRKTEVLLDIPGNFNIAELPEDFQLSNDLFSFEIKYEKLGNNKIAYTKQLKTFVNLIPKKRFEEWNNALKKLKKACFQPIILQKK